MADRLRGRSAAVLAGVALEVPIASGDSVVGAVLLLGDASDDAAEYLSLAAVASLTDLALADAWDEVERNVRGSFPEDLRARAEQHGEDVPCAARRAWARIGPGARSRCAPRSTAGGPATSPLDRTITRARSPSGCPTTAA